MSALEYILIGGAAGGVVGGLLGALITLLMVRRSRPAPVEPEPAPDADAGRIQRRRQTAALLDRATQVMVAYSAVIDAADAGDRAGLRAAVERMRGAGAIASQGDWERGADASVAEAARAFFAFVDDTQARVEERLATGREGTVAGELRSRAEALAQAVSRLHAAVARYVG